MGRIFQIDWAKAWAAGNLDRAVTRILLDDAVVNGTRPEFVRIGNRTLLATADYGNRTPQIRLYDPEKLLVAGRSSAEGVVVSRIPCGPFNQSLHWDAANGRLTFVQNVTLGRGWQLDTVDLARAVAAGSLDASGVRVALRTYPPHDELEGYLRLPGGRELFITSSQNQNLVSGVSEAIPSHLSPDGEMRVAFENTMARNPIMDACLLNLGRVAK